MVNTAPEMPGLSGSFGTMSPPTKVVHWSHTTSNHVKRLYLFVRSVEVGTRPPKIGFLNSDLTNAQNDEFDSLSNFIMLPILSHIAIIINVPLEFNSCGSNLCLKLV